MEINNRIKEIRINSKLNQSEMAKKIGISQGSLSDIESGKTKPALDTVISICKNFDVNAHWLLTGKEKIEKSDNPVSFEEFKKETDILIENSKLSQEEIKDVMLKVFEIAKLINKKD